jgi:hypothetical protein
MASLLDAVNRLLSPQASFAINLHDVPEKIIIDKSGPNTAAIKNALAASRRLTNLTRRLWSSKGSRLEPIAPYVA